MAKIVKKKKFRKVTKRIMIFGIVASLLSVFVLGTITTIIVDIMNKYNEAKDLETKLARLEEHEKDLNQEIIKLQDPEYLARYAREKYFYSKDNELIIRIPTE